MYKGTSNICISVHKTRSHGRSGGICILLKKCLLCEVRLDICVNNENIEVFCIEMIQKSSKNIFINVQYRYSAKIFLLMFSTYTQQTKGNVWRLLEYLKHFLNNKKLNLKKAWRINLTPPPPPCDFSKNVFSGERKKPWFCDF